MDADRVDARSRALSAVASRQGVLAVSAALVGTAVVAWHHDTTEAAKEKRCKNGPCNYGLCLHYLDEKTINLPPGTREKYLYYLDAHCCSYYATRKQGSAYSKSVKRCIQNALNA